MIKQISSVQNPYIKKILKLQEKAKERKKTGLFLIEGKREISLAISGNFTIDTILFYPDIISETEVNTLIKSPVIKIKITKEVYQKIAYRDSTEGITAVIKEKEFLLKDIQFKSKNPLILVAESLEKPGNIGALLRTADAANIDAVFIANPKTDLYNPNIIRASVGCLFTNQIAVGSSSEIIAFLQKNDINIYCTTLQNSNIYFKENFTSASAIIVGTESVGLSQEWRDVAIQNITIPMQGKIDSINVSVTAAVVVFEAKRQREGVS